MGINNNRTCEISCSDCGPRERRGLRASISEEEEGREEQRWGGREGRKAEGT